MEKSMETKKEIRKQILQKRDALSFKQRQEKSEQIAKKVIVSDAFQNSKIVLLFASYKSEVDVNSIIKVAFETKKQVYFPKVTGSEMEFYQVSSLLELENGYCGIKEPIVDKARKLIPQKEEKLFVLVPGIAFDKEGGRIGYGKGFYDRFFQKLEKVVPKTNLCKMAVAFACQILDNGSIIKEEHDSSPDYIVTEEEIWKL